MSLWTGIQSPFRWAYRVFSSATDKVLGWALQREQQENADFDADAHWAIAEQTPHGARVAVWLTLIVVVSLLVWAARAEVDEVTRGEGKVIPTRQVQIIQSLDGGIISEVKVRVGEMVQEGQVLLKIDPVRMVSSLRENRSQYLALLVKAARLQALADGKLFVPPPEAITEAPQIVEAEQALYQSRRSELESVISIARQQSNQRSQEINSTEVRQKQAAQSYDLTSRELEMTRPLLKSGAVSDVDLLRLERDLARFRGERDQAAADIPRLQSAIAEANRKIENVELEFKNQARGELSEVNAKLAALSEGSVALQDKVNQTELRSPVRGTVKQVFSYTVGGVVQPGKDLLEIIPTDDVLLLEARILPKDIAFLRPGQPALVKFTAYDFSIYGGLEATLEHIGADTVTDDRGNAFYLVKVRTATNTLGKKRLPIIPGMVAEVDILTGKKTILSYLLKPILRAKANALSER